MWQHSGRRMRAIVILAMMVLGLAGCSNTGQQSSALNAFFPQSRQNSAALVALNGGIVDPQTTQGWSRGSRNKALAAEYLALSSPQSGQAFTWQNQRSGLSGEVYAGQPYTVGSQYCRQYTHTVVQRGETTEATGTACRNENGEWTPLV